MDGRGVGLSDVLAGRDQHAPQGEARVLSRVDHAGQPVEGGVGIRAPQALDEGARRVVVVISVLVVEDGPPLDALLGRREAHAYGRVLRGRPGLGAGLDRELEGVEEAAGVSVRYLDDVLEGALLEVDLPSAVAPLLVA